MRIVRVNDVALAPDRSQDLEHRAGIDRGDPRNGMEVGSELSRLVDQSGIAASHQALLDIADRTKLLHQESGLVLAAAVLSGGIYVQNAQEVHPRKLSGGHRPSSARTVTRASYGRIV